MFLTNTPLHNVSFLDNYGYVAPEGEEGNDDLVPEHIANKDQWKAIKRKRDKFLARLDSQKKALNSASFGLKMMPIRLTCIRTQGLARTKEEDPFLAKARTEFEINEGT